MFFSIYYTSRASLVAQTLKRLPTVRETWVRSLGQEDLLEKEMATHSSILAWRIPWTEDPGRLQSMGLQRVRHDWVTSLYIKVEILLSPGVSKNTLTFNISFKVWGSTRSSSLLIPSAITVYHYSLWQGYRIRSAKRRGKWGRFQERSTFRFQVSSPNNSFVGSPNFCRKQWVIIGME